MTIKALILVVLSIALSHKNLLCACLKTHRTSDTAVQDTPQAAQDRVDLANFPVKIPYSGAFYSGYLPSVDKSKLFYWYFESPRRDDPLVVWLTGGPGCSSLLAAVYENGPFLFETESTRIHANAYAWTDVAHVLYIESPGGVGFSQCPHNKFECAADDDSTQRQNLQALVSFFDRFPRARQARLYITGESYGGVYVPYLAKAVLDHNDQADREGAPESKMRLEGVAIGNGCTLEQECSIFPSRFHLEQARNLAFIDDTFFAEIMACKGIYSLSESAQPLTQECVSLLHQFNDLIAGINMYNTQGVCYHTNLLLASAYTPLQAPTGDVQSTAHAHSHHHQHDHPVLPPYYASMPPCVEGKGIWWFLTHKDVLRALHVERGAYEWTACTSRIDYKRGSSYHLYKHLLGRVRVLVYSGTADMAVPTDGTLHWVNKLIDEHGLQTVANWTSWSVRDGKKQNGDRDSDGTDHMQGYIWKVQDDFTFMSFNGAGHMVPQNKRRGSQEMMRRYLAGDF